MAVRVGSARHDIVKDVKFYACRSSTEDTGVLSQRRMVEMRRGGVGRKSAELRPFQAMNGKHQQSVVERTRGVAGSGRGYRLWLSPQVLMVVFSNHAADDDHLSHTLRATLRMTLNRFNNEQIRYSISDP